MIIFKKLEKYWTGSSVKKEPVRLYPQKQENKIKNEEKVIILWITLILLGFIIFFAICNMIIPCTHGYYWY